MSTQSWQNLVETSDIPVLKRGGPSSSDTLNIINQRIQQDIVRINAKMQDLDRRQQLTAVYLEQQAVGIQALVNSLSTAIPSAPAGRGIADFYSSSYIDPSNTSNIDQDFGQATLPILSIQDKLSSVDSQGNIWIPDDSRLRFTSQSTYTPGIIPSDDQFYTSVEDQFGIGKQSDTFFLGGFNPTNTYVFLEAVLPQSLNTSNLANRITFYPIPAFSQALVGAYYMDTTGSWNFIDFSYLLGYTTAYPPYPPQASFLGPTRLHFPPTEITQVCIVMNSYGWWGVQEFGVELVEYGVNSTLAVNMSSYSPNQINNVILNGKDPSIINSYNTTIAGNTIQVALSQTQSFSSPIITSIDARW
jgi:hypothetical protein